MSALKDHSELTFYDFSFIRIQTMKGLDKYLNFLIFSEFVTSLHSVPLEDH